MNVLLADAITGDSTITLYVLGAIGLFLLRITWQASKIDTALNTVTKEFEKHRIEFLAHTIEDREAQNILMEHKFQIQALQHKTDTQRIGSGGHRHLEPGSGE